MIHFFCRSGNGVLCRNRRQFSLLGYVDWAICHNRVVWKPSVRVPCHKHGRGSAMAKHAIESRCCSTFGMDAHARTTTVKGVPSRIFRKFADV